jgi:hypothetical protein
LVFHSIQLLIRREKKMENPQLGPSPVLRYWKDLMDAAVVETACNDLSQRIQDAQNAVMDEIETSFPTATTIERQSLVNALNALRELRRMCETPKPRKRPKTIFRSDGAAEA